MGKANELRNTNPVRWCKRSITILKGEKTIRNEYSPGKTEMSKSRKEQFLLFKSDFIF